MRDIYKTPEAILAIAEIYAYTKESWGQNQAERYIDNLDSAFVRLAENPHLGTMRYDVPNGYFTYAIGRHMAVYRADNSTLQVIAILHQAMDISQRTKALLNKRSSRK